MHPYPFGSHQFLKSLENQVWLLGGIVISGVQQFWNMPTDTSKHWKCSVCLEPGGGQVRQAKFKPYASIKIGSVPKKLQCQVQIAPKYFVGRTYHHVCCAECRAALCGPRANKHWTESCAKVARATPCKLKAKRLAHKKFVTQKKQVKKQEKKAVQQERPCTPRTADANRKKIVAGTSRSSIKKVDNAMSTAEKWQRLVIEHYQSGH